MLGKKAEVASANGVDTQVTCIDLPGETVKCWRSSAHLQVVLRKHRDIIFDLQLFPGQEYSVTADSSDFYDANAKKLRSVGQRATFKDGEKAHYWISRDFAGSLILRAAGKIIGTYRPNDLDFNPIGQLLSDKPAPLLVTVHASSKLSAVPSLTLYDAKVPLFDPDLALAAQPRPDEQTMHIIELKETNANIPDKVLDFFKSGGTKPRSNPIVQ